ncbi:hypothetical protein [Paraburkholderia silvatlantica]|uniref:Uncharacterized protein n=1 Tax=Paraburkholderia silvatlantica TaxID=321895 RepID=A0A2U1A124_9BURK|nr:hypothetical protein [Paraburkholderia silvatlantica]MBB2926511.1 hypothetical protein [Paraburkholderia silvatlantica]PVY25106.1 hypothetical protein C7411_125137 [Paraburkholderia silvatlantica]PXW30190.1 hypothetical protein C7413_129109 [Paraburkholderia silvatlantica]PYE16757.1 hypothetical protein C7410_128106 [Paraburkholderia silvatlantica]TDQ81930.1 hypothetical protein C7412_124138 [Paraburkholderia silvatlantica]
MEFNNGAVLEALRLALYRQIPWHKRPAIFTSLRAQGLIQTVAQIPPPSTKSLPTLQIAVLTDKGQREMQRIEASKHVSGWLDDDYFATFLAEVVLA